MRIFFFLCCFLCLEACSTDNSTVPDNIIQQDKMADIIVDISLAESFTEMFIMKDSSLVKDSVLKNEISKVLALHKISIPSFSTSYNYYSKHPSVFKVMMDSASARVNVRRDRMYATPLAPLPKSAQ